MQVDQIYFAPWHRVLGIGKFTAKESKILTINVLHQEKGCLI